jgi:hypothetical protein
MFYFVLYGSLAFTSLLIGVLGAIAEARQRAEWRKVFSENEVRHG